MPGDWDKNVHPDLVEEAPTTAAPPEPTPAPAPESAAISDQADSPEPDQPETQAPDWFAQVRDAKDPTEALRSILKNVPYDQLEKDEVFSGLIGNVAERRVKALQARQEQQAAERAKLEAAANNDLYTLGEMTQREMQGQIASQQAAQSAAPFMNGVVKFQQTLPEAIQKDVAGKSFGVGKGYDDGVAEYIEYVSDARVKLELQKRESALRKSLMAELNGDEPVPERDSGTPGRVREVTDEQIAAMSLREYDALFDENGRPKPGVRHRSTRGIPLTPR